MRGKNGEAQRIAEYYMAEYGYQGWIIETRTRNDACLRWSAKATAPNGDIVERYGVTEEGAVELVKLEIDFLNHPRPAT